MLDILHRDDRLIAIHKPPGLLVHRSDIDRHETRFAVQLLRDQIGQRVWPLHRLDKGASGVLLFALDAASAREFGRQFENQSVEKHYRAIVRGWPDAQGMIDHPLTRTPDDFAHRRAPRDGVANPQEMAALPALTRYRRLATVELAEAVDRYPTSRYALLALQPQSGRQHQLRRHLKHIAHPIIGDATWGKGRHNRFFQQRFGVGRLLLACTRMVVICPEDGRKLVISAPLEASFAALVEQLGWSASL